VWGGGGVDVLRPFNSVHKCRVTLLIREVWIREPGIPPAVKGQMGPVCWGGARAREYGQSLGRKLIICLGKYAAVFQAESHAILACIYEIQMNDRQGKYISIYSDTR
jgi:hypothetical protein